MKIRFDEIILAALVVLIVILGMSHACATPLNSEQARSIYAVAYGQYHGPREWLDMQPPTMLVDQEFLCETAGQDVDCRVLALYIDGSVYIRHDMDFSTPLPASILLHEYVHHLQALKHRQLYDAIQGMPEAEACEVWLAREQEAYAIQAYVLERVGAQHDAAVVRRSGAAMTCS